MTQKKSAFDILAQTLPPIILRKDVGKYLDGLISSGYLANLNSEGKGPKFFTSGRRVVYLREDLIEWLEVWLQKKEK